MTLLYVTEFLTTFNEQTVVNSAWWQTYLQVVRSWSNSSQALQVWRLDQSWHLLVAVFQDQLQDDLNPIYQRLAISLRLVCEFENGLTHPQPGLWEQAWGLTICMSQANISYFFRRDYMVLSNTEFFNTTILVHWEDIVRLHHERSESKTVRTAWTVTAPEILTNWSNLNTNSLLTEFISRSSEPESMPSINAPEPKVIRSRHIDDQSGGPSIRDFEVFITKYAKGKKLK